MAGEFVLAPAPLRTGCRQPPVKHRAPAGPPAGSCGRPGWASGLYPYFTSSKENCGNIAFHGTYNPDGGVTVTPVGVILPGRRGIVNFFERICELIQQSGANLPLFPPRRV